MKFIIRHTVRKYNRHYWIDIEGKKDKQNKDILQLLGISLEQYNNELLNFNSDKSCINSNIVFSKLDEIKNALQYLNDKYGIILALLGE